jgi:hypothetical protein
VNGGRVGKRVTTTTNPENDLSTNNMVRSERGLDRICTPLPTKLREAQYPSLDAQSMSPQECHV